MYRDDEAARTARAGALIDEIAQLERDRLALASTEHRLEAARAELSSLQPVAVAPPRPTPDLATHVAAYVISALVSFAAYTLLG